MLEYFVDSTTVTWTATTGSGTMGTITQVAPDTYTIPYSGLADGDSYTLTIGTGVTDTCDNPLDASVDITISVEICPDPVAGDPTVTSALTVTEPWGTTGGSYTLTFSEDVFNVDTTTITWATVTGSGTMGTITQVAADTYTIPYSGVADGDEYTITIGTGILDSCDNPIAAPVSITIEVATCVDPVAGIPTVTSTDQLYPPGTTSGSYTLTFSEDVQGVDSSSITWAAVTGSGTMGTITPVSANTYTIPFSGALDGDQYTITIGAAITDTCANALGTPVTITLDMDVVVAVWPFYEDFESMTGTYPDGQNDWVSSPTSAYSWRLDTGTTLSFSTGPNTDHTIATSSGQYVYTEASLPAASGDTAYLTTPLIDLTVPTNPAMSFWYHMYGSTMGTLDVEIDDGSGWANLVTITGQQHSSGTSAWSQQIIDLSAYQGSEVEVRFIGTMGSDYWGDMAIDDVVFCDAFGVDPTTGYIGCQIDPGATTNGCPDISTTGTALTLSVNDNDVISPGFTFNYYGSNYTDVNVASNGTVYFEPVATYLGYVNGSIPGANPYGVSRFIAAYWDNLDPTGGTVMWESLGSGQDQRTVIHWDVPLAGSSTNGEFTVVLYESSNNIRVCYEDMALGGGATATTGLQGSDTQGLEYSYNSAVLVDGMILDYWLPSTGSPIKITEVNWGDDFVVLTNTGVYDVDLDPFAMFFADSLGSQDLAFGLPAHVLGPGDSVYVAETPLTGDIDVVGNIYWSGGRGGWVSLCYGTCNTTTGSNFVDFMAWAEGQAAPALPSGISFTPGSVTGASSSADSYWRDAYNSSHPGYYQSDWIVATASR